MNSSTDMTLVYIHIIQRITNSLWKHEDGLPGYITFKRLCADCIMHHATIIHMQKFCFVLFLFRTSLGSVV